MENKEEKTIKHNAESKDSEIDKVVNVKSNDDKVKPEDSAINNKNPSTEGADKIEETPKEQVEIVPTPYKRETFAEKAKRLEKEKILAWVPKTKLGKEVKAKKIKNIDQVLDNKSKILESEIVDSLVNLESDLFSMGQSKGKFGGGKRRAWRQTQKKTKEGNVPTFSAFAIVGDGKGHIGVGSGKSMETLPARDKAIRKAKLNIFKVGRACASFDCSCSKLHTIPYKVEGKCGSVVVKLIPAPQGTGLVVGRELKKVMRLAGIKDIYSKTFGQKKTTFNLVKACINALEKTNMENRK